MFDAEGSKINYDSSYPRGDVVTAFLAYLISFLQVTPLGNVLKYVTHSDVSSGGCQYLVKTRHILDIKSYFSVDFVPL